MTTAATRNPKPIKALGRYAHEALAVDPKRHQIYLTEDATDPNGLVYRFTPPDSARPLRRGSLGQLGDTDGTLEAMRALDYGTLVPDLSVAQVGTTYDLEWVTVPDRDASVVTPPATTPVSTRKQFIWSGDPAAPAVASLGAESSKVPGGATAAPSSSRRSRAMPPLTGARLSTTVRCGSSIRTGTPSPWCCSSRTHRSTTTTTPTVPTTSPSHRTAE